MVFPTEIFVNLNFYTNNNNTSLFFQVNMDVHKLTTNGIIVVSSGRLIKQTTNNKPKTGA